MYKRTILLQLIIVLLAITLPVSAATSAPANDTAPAAVGASTEAVPTATLSSEVLSTETSTVAEPVAAGVSYPIVDTGQDHCYSDTSGIPCPTEGEAFYGQDAQYQGVQARYVDNSDGTVTDLNTGLMWQRTPDLANKMTFNEAVAGAGSFDLAGYTDWRLPTIKELYSLIDFNGSVGRLIPYVDTDYFEFRFGDTSLGERDIDAQYWSGTEYVGTTMGGSHTVFGVNFADGRIKGYGTSTPHGRQMEQFVRYVRGSSGYGVNDFVDNGDGTITDQATGLMWQRSDSGETLNWAGTLAYCESLDYAGYDDWRLPNAKELQSIVDYSRSPQTTGSAAIDPVFDVTDTESWYWSSTTHLDNGVRNAVYIAFGQAFGLPNGNLIDVHGAGAQRSDPKSGDPANFSEGRGSPGQQDQVRIYNSARCVRDGVSVEIFTGGEVDEFSGGRGQPPGGPQGQPGQGGPPPEAIDACSGAGEGDACEFTAPFGTITGTCLQVPGDFACVPADHPQGGGNRGMEPPGGGPGQGRPGGPQGQGGPGGPQGPRPDLAAAAVQLGTSEEALRAALGPPGQGPPNLASAAQQLGITEQELIDALGMPPGAHPPGADRNSFQPGNPRA